MIRKISAKDARSRFSELMGRVRYGHEIIIVEKQNQPMVAMIPVDQLEKHLSARQLAFERLDEIREELPGRSEAEVEADVEEAIGAVRRSP